MTRPHRPRRPASGVTVIELMVALVVGLLLSGVALMTLTNFEARKRVLNASNDLEQSAQIALYRLDRVLRSAGAGLGQSAERAYGCPLHLARSGKQQLPAKAALPAPFAAVDPGDDGVFRVAPLWILPGQGAGGSDVIAALSAVPNGGTVAPFDAAASGPTLPIARHSEFAAGDLALLVDQPDDAGLRRPCLLVQVDAKHTPGAEGLAIATSPYATSVGDASLDAYSDEAVALRVGTAGAPPQWMLLGAGADGVLHGMDLLAPAGTPPQALAEGVVALHARYGVDTDLDGRVDRWVSAASGDYALAALSAGDATAAARLQQILAVRVGLVLRSLRPEKEPVAPQTLTLFADLAANDKALPVTRKLTDAERLFRHLAVEQTVPVRNNLLLRTP